MIKQKLDQLFETILSDLNQEFIGQEAYFEALCRYFHEKIEKKAYGTLLVVGEPNTFKKNAVKSIFRHLDMTELLGPFELIEIDMGNYDFKLGFNVFLTDLINVLKSDAKGIIFKNIELASEQMLGILSAIAPSKTIQLEKPYALRDMFLVEVEEHQAASKPIESIACPDKFYIFGFNRRPNDQLEQFMANNLKQRDDVLYTRTLTKDEKLSMMQRILNKVLREVEAIHQIKIAFNPKGKQGDAQVKRLYKYIASFEEHENFNLMDYTRYKIGEPLDKLLKTQHVQGESVYLYVTDNEIFCRINDDRYNLRDYVTSSLSEVKYRLQTRTGLKHFKTFMTQIENNYKVQRIRKQMGLKTLAVNLNTIFTGNAGTGKSESAKLMYDYLWALGVLQTERFVIASQGDFMTDDLVKLRENVAALFEKAVGGMLFIDEISSIFDNGENRVNEAFFEALNKGYERYGSQLIILLSGKDDEMFSMLEDYALEDVFPNRVHFTDYTPSEMYDRAVAYAKQKGYSIDSNLKDALIDLFDKTQIKEKKGLGNARFVRNVIDRAIAELRKNYLYDPNQAFDMLTKQHFNFNFSINFDLESRLAGIIGLDEVKNLLRAQYKLLIAQEKRRSVGVHTEIEQNLNMVFAGNPGTGKTSIARLVAEMLSAMGFLKNGQLIETDRSGFVSDIPGETSKKTELKFKEALGGILFIDEAYTLANDAIGREAIETLLKLIEDYSKEVIVILAGYTEEMETFFDVNIGLRSRFPLWTTFNDYKPDELLAMAKVLFKSKGFRISKEAETEMAKNFIDIYENADMQSGNGRLVRNYVENLIRIQSIRIAEEHTSANEMNLIMDTDIERYMFSDRNQDYNFSARLETYTGNSESKQYLFDFYKMLKVNDLRKRMGYAVDLNKYNNLIFTGEMGTGKHKMIDLMGELLTNFGLVKSKLPYELNYEEILVNLEQGLALEDIFNKGMGRVILIDNADKLVAYEKFQSLMSAFIKFIDKNKTRTYFILNCSDQGLQTLFAEYPSLAYRFPVRIHFENYSAEALRTLVISELEVRGYILESGTDKALMEALEELHLNKYMVLKNGLLAKQFLDYIIRMQSVRIFDEKEAQEKLMHIEAADVVSAKKKFIEKNT